MISIGSFQSKLLAAEYININVDIEFKTKEIENPKLRSLKIFWHTEVVYQFINFYF